MVISPASTVPTGQDGGDGRAPAAAGLLAQAAAGPGLWEDLLGELRRAGLIAELLADGAITAAVAQAEHGHKLDRALTAEVTAMCVIAGALFPDQGYDLVLARTFAMPGLPVKPGTVTPSGPALSKARALLGEQVLRRIFELDAARAARSWAPARPGMRWRPPRSTAPPSSCSTATSWQRRSGSRPGGQAEAVHGGARVQRLPPVDRAAIGGYHDGENTLADELEASFPPDRHTADRGFFYMDR